MGYTLERLADDCRAALREQEATAARETIRACCSRACKDDEFVAAHFGSMRRHPGPDPGHETTAAFRIGPNPKDGPLRLRYDPEPSRVRAFHPTEPEKG